MKKIRLFSTKATKVIEGDEAELYLDFYFVLNRDYIFTFLIDAPNLACSGRNPIKLWKHFLILFEEEYVKYMRRYENVFFQSRKTLKNTLVDLQLEIEENVLADDPDTLLPFLQARESCVALIQQKIKKLKGENKC